MRCASLLLVMALPVCAQFGSNATKLRGRSVCATAPADTQALVWSASNGCWGPAAAGVQKVTSLPATCAVGDLAYLTTGSIGLYSCSATNTWSSVGTASEIVSWTFGNQAPVVAGDAVATPWIAAGTEASAECHIAAGTSPTGADLIVQVTKNGTNAFTVTLPASTANNTTVTTTPTATTLAKGDVLKASITQAGSGVPGQNVMVRCRLVVSAW